jgi:hypothetical protein
VSDRDQREEMPAEVRAAMRKLSPRTRDLVRAVAAGMAHHVRELQARVAELEARPHLHDAGVWDEQKVYGINAIVTDHVQHGSLSERRVGDLVTATMIGD